MIENELRTLLGTIIVLLIAIVVVCAGILRRQLVTEQWQKAREKPIDAMGAWCAANLRKRQESRPVAIH